MKKIISLALICAMTVGALLPSFTAKAKENSWYIDGEVLHIKGDWQGGAIREDIKPGIREIVFDEVVKPVTLEKSFAGFDSLELIDFGNVDFSEVGSMESMFENSPAIEDIDLSNKDASKVTTMKKAFKDCVSLRSLTLENLKTDNLGSMESAFENCKTIINLNLKGINTSKVTNMSRAFYNCCSMRNAKTVLDLTSFDTRNVTSMKSMFENCMTQEIDLSSFDVPRVTDMSNMFKNAQNVYTIYASKDFKIEGPSYPIYAYGTVFEGNYSLVGRQADFDRNDINMWSENETKFEKYGNKGIEFAKINRNGGDGYFTYKEAPIIHIDKPVIVTYDLNGEQGKVPAPQEYNARDTFEVAAGISRDAFKGFSDGVNMYQPGDIYKLGENDVTLRAVWENIEAVIEENGDVIAKGTFKEMMGQANPNQTIRLVKDVKRNVSNLSAAFLDLNGHTLKTDKLVLDYTQVIDTSNDTTGTLICNETHFVKSEYIPMYAKAEYSFKDEVVTPGWHFYKLDFSCGFGGHFNPKEATIKRKLGAVDDNDYCGVRMNYEFRPQSWYNRKALIVLANQDITEAGLKLTVAPFIAIPNKGMLDMPDDPSAFKDNPTMMVGDEMLQGQNVKYYSEAMEGTHPTLLAKRGADLRENIKIVAKNFLECQGEQYGGVRLYGTNPGIRIWATYAKFKLETNDFVIHEEEVQYVREDLR